MQLGYNKKLNYAITAILVTSIAYVLYAMINTNYSASIPPEKECPSEDSISILRFVRQSSPDDPVATFPYDAFLNAASFCNIKHIQHDLNVLDSCFKNSQNIGKEIYVKALTEKLELRISKSFENPKLDSLITLAQWVEKFDCYKDIDETNARTYKIIYRHWMNFLSNHLGQYYETDSDIKYDFKFRYLIAFCQSKKYSPSLGDSMTEKVIANLLDHKWAYLLNRFWNGTGPAFKFATFAGLILTIYGFVCIFKIHLKK